MSVTFPDPQLRALLNTFYAAAAAVPTFANATLSTIAGVLNPLQAVQARITALLAAVDAEVDTDGFAGLVAGIDQVGIVAALTGQIAVNTQERGLLGLQAYLGRIGNNLAAITASPNTITLAGGNLFALADQEYGDPTDWTAIAGANGLTDPFITGPVTLVIPPSVAATGGVLSA